MRGKKLELCFYCLCRFNRCPLSSEPEMGRKSNLLICVSIAANNFFGETEPVGVITFGEIISKMEDSSQNRIGFLNTETISISK